MAVITSCEVFGCQYNDGGDCELDYVNIGSSGECKEFVYEEDEDEN